MELRVLEPALVISSRERLDVTYIKDTTLNSASIMHCYSNFSTNTHIALQDIDRSTIWSDFSQALRSNGLFKSVY